MGEAAVDEDALFEREEELARLAELAGEAVDGRGRLVVVEGPPGIGKTRLLQAVRAEALRRGMTALYARGDDLESEVPFGVVRQLFELPLRREEPSARETLLDGPAGLSRPMLLGGDSTPAESDAGDRFAAALHSLYWVTSNLAERSPLLVAVDDAHWSDAPSLRYLEYLLRRLDDLPVLLVLALRPREPDARADMAARLGADPRAVVLRPAPLSHSAVAAVVRATLGDDADPGFCATCHAATAGNPFLLRGLVRALLDDGVAPDLAAIASVSGLVPDSVARHVHARLVRMSAEAQELARAVAVLGGDVELQAAAALAGLDERVAAGAVHALATADLLHAGQPLRFIHPLVRETVYTDLGVNRRAVWHGRAARILHEAGADRDRIAAQLLASQPTGGGWAVDVLHEAATQALARGAPAIAATYVRRALREPPPAGARAQLIHALGAAESAQGDPAGIAHLREALDAAPPGAPHARIARELAHALFPLGGFDEAVSLLDAAIAQLGDADRQLALELEADAACAGRLVPSTAALTSSRLRRFSTAPPGETPAERQLLATLALQRALEGASAAEVAALAVRALDGGLAAEQSPGSPIVFDAVYLLIVADEVKRAEQLCQTVLAEARTRGALAALSMFSNVRSMLLWRCGSIAEAETDARTSARIADGAGFGSPMIEAALIDALIERGELAAAREALGPADAGEIPDGFVPNFLLHSRAQLRLASGDDERGLADLLELSRRQKLWGEQNPATFPYRSSAAVALARLGDLREARQLAGEELELAHGWGTPRAIGIALRARGLVAGGRDGLADLRGAVATLAHSPARLEHARALTELGVALHRTGERTDARQPLRHALDLARRCGATALQRRAHQELLATGARPRRVPVSGVDALTPSERRVAALAADGLTNREIGHALFLSRKTVESHLGRAYRKLGLRSRAELAGELGGADQPGTGP